MRMNAVGAALVVLAGSLGAQDSVEVRARAAIATLASGIIGHDAAKLEALFDERFHMGSLAGPTARSIVARGFASMTSTPTAIELDSVRRADSGYVAYAAFISTKRSTQRVFLTRDFRVSSIDVQVRETAEGRGDGAGAVAGAGGSSTGGAQQGSSFASRPDDPSVREPALRRELLARADSDQAARRRVTGGATTATVSVAADPIAKIDARNTARMKEVLARYGWPGRDLVGVDGSIAAFLLIQHADADTALQAMALGKVAEAVRAGQARPETQAYLHDRVQVARRLPQRYGTQMNFVDNRMVPYAIEDSSNVDRRRAEMGLEPLAAYMARMQAPRPARPN